MFSMTFQYSISENSSLFYLKVLVTEANGLRVVTRVVDGTNGGLEVVTTGSGTLISSISSS